MDHYTWCTEEYTAYLTHWDTSTPAFLEECIGFERRLQPGEKSLGLQLQSGWGGFCWCGHPQQIEAGHRDNYVQGIFWLLITKDLHQLSFWWRFFCVFYLIALCCWTGLACHSKKTCGSRLKWENRRATHCTVSLTLLPNIHVNIFEDIFITDCSTKLSGTWEFTKFFLFVLISSKAEQ